MDIYEALDYGSLNLEHLGAMVAVPTVANAVYGRRLV